LKEEVCKVEIEHCLTDAISIRQSDDRQAVLSKLKQIDNGAGLKLVEFQ